MGVNFVSIPLITGAGVRGMQEGLGTLKEATETGELIERPDQTVGFDKNTALMGLEGYN